MDDLIEVRRAGLTDWRAVRATRLHALTDAPEAFGSTLNREAAFDDVQWQRRVEDGAFFLGWVDGQPRGIAAGYVDPEKPDVPLLVAMWVAPQLRGSQAAGRLIEAVCGWAEQEGACEIMLWVTDGNSRALRCYERLGFRLTGIAQPLPRLPAIAEHEMRRPLPWGPC